MDHQTYVAPSRRLRLTAHQARQLFDEHALSGVGIMAFCRDHGRSYARLKYWRRHLAMLGEVSPAQTGFVEVVPPALVSSNPPAVSTGVVISVGAGCRIQVSRGFDAVVLRAVVEALTVEALT